MFRPFLCTWALGPWWFVACTASPNPAAPPAAPIAAPAPSRAAAPASQPVHPPQTPSALAVEIPAFANSSCPIMGKPPSEALFTDTVAGRIYVCCKPCVPKIQADVAAAVQTAFPTAQALHNTLCPVTGDPLGADAVAVTLQGYAFEVCCSDCAEAAKRDAQTTLVHLLRPDVRDLDNPTCPIRGTPVAPNAVVIVGDELVHLADLRAVDAVLADPAAALAKARASAASRPARAPHVPRPGTSSRGGS